MVPLPQPHHFITLVERFERNLSRVLAVVLIVVLAAGTLQLALGTAQALLQPSQNWLDGGLIQLLDRLLLLLIGLEVLQNITAYLKDHSIHTEMVVLTALTAVARKVIVMPPGHDKDPMLLLGVGVVIVCLAAAYNLLRTTRPSP
ncbi:MAG: phosphate-starvation-inducible PsiE family protein [Cyanobacteria bacterium]|nr:phosphate-starvation-inducible PsiE family protein [Cyanobacteriota bacterium]